MKVGDVVADHCFYLDASALLKRYWREEGTEFLNLLYGYAIERGSMLYTAKHSIAEISLASYRLFRECKI